METKVCDHCGVIFSRKPRRPMSTWKTARFCGHPCHHASRQRKMSTCEICSAQFRPRGGSRPNRFCSQACFIEGERRKIPKRYKTVTVDGVKMALHRATKEAEIGRKLLPGEIVHHRDHDKLNNDPSNLEITSQSRHSRYHMMGNQNARRKRA